MRRDFTGVENDGLRVLITIWHKQMYRLKEKTEWDVNLLEVKTRGKPLNEVERGFYMDMLNYYTHIEQVLAKHDYMSEEGI